MIFTGSSNIYETFAPLNKVLKCFGVMPFSFNLQNGGVDLKEFDLVYILLNCFLWIFLMHWNINKGYLKDNANLEAKKFLMTGYLYILIFQIIGCFYIQILSFNKRKNHKKFFGILFDVDKMVRFIMMIFY